MANLTEERIKILIVQTAFLGDIILTTPLIYALKTIFPSSHLALLTTPLGKSALSGIPELDEIISYDKHNTEKGIRFLFKKAQELREKKFDLALSPHRSFRTALLLALSGIPVLVGFKSASLSWIYHFRIERPRALHEVERNLKLLEPVAELPKDFEPRIKLKVPERFELSQFGIKPEDRPLIGFAPGSAWQTKCWPPEKYAGLAKMIKAELKATIVLLGAKQDQGLCSEIMERARVPMINLSQKTELGDFFGIISQLDLLVCNDSAPVHIASAFSIPTVVIFGPTVPEFGFGPWKNSYRIIQRNLNCRPCHHHGPKQCPEGHFRCMREIEPEQVFSAVQELLSEKKLTPKVS